MMRIREAESLLKVQKQRLRIVQIVYWTILRR
jgi:hypothetical protein